MQRRGDSEPKARQRALHDHAMLHTERQNESTTKGLDIMEKCKAEPSYNPILKIERAVDFTPGSRSCLLAVSRRCRRSKQASGRRRHGGNWGGVIPPEFGKGFRSSSSPMADNVNELPVGSCLAIITSNSASVTAPSISHMDAGPLLLLVPAGFSHNPSLLNVSEKCRQIAYQTTERPAVKAALGRSRHPWTNNSPVHPRQGKSRHSLLLVMLRCWLPISP